MTRSPRPRKSASISDSLQHQLNMYALAASAAGVSLLALAPPSEARIVYTKTQYVIGSPGIYPLDLNHDRNIDFVIQEFACSYLSQNVLKINGAYGNGVEGGNFFAVALNKGASIGPRQGFLSNVYSGEVMAAYGCGTQGGCVTSGQWVNLTRHYLGLRFQISGKVHYGWARMNVKLKGCKITATLTGYAYETIPRKAIHAGQTEGPTDEGMASPKPTESARRKSTLGQLATGAPPAPLWSQPW
jgi:hypothetical protein